MLDDLEQGGRVDLVLAQLGAADVQRAEAALVMGRDRNHFEDPLDFRLVKSLALEPLTRGAGDQLLSAWARRDPLGRDADQPARADLGRGRETVEGVQLLRFDARDRRWLVLREPGFDAHLGAARALAGADELRDVLGQVLGLEGRVAEHYLADRLVDDLLEARHVRALLVRAEFDHAFEPGREQLLASVLAQPDHLFDSGHADSGETQRERRRLRLNVGQQRGGCVNVGHRLRFGCRAAAGRMADTLL